MSKFDDFKRIEKDLKEREPKNPLDSFRGTIDNLALNVPEGSSEADVLKDIKVGELAEEDRVLYNEFLGNRVTVSELNIRANSGSEVNESQKHFALYLRDQLVEYLRNNS